MNLGFDLDKVFIDYPPLVPAKLIDRLYKEKQDGILLYRVPSLPEQIFRKLTHYPIFRPPIKENIKIVRDLALKNKNKYYLVSGRFGFLRRETKIIVKKYGFDKIFDDMFFNFKNHQPHFFKAQIIKKLKLDRYVDDDLPLLKFLARDNPKVKFFWLNGEERRHLANNLFAIKHLLEMFP